MNPVAILFWVLGGLIGYVIDNNIGAVWGLITTLGISFFFSIIR
jgi:hypothetical protein